MNRFVHEILECLDRIGASTTARILREILEKIPVLSERPIKSEEELWPYLEPHSEFLAEKFDEYLEEKYEPVICAAKYYGIEPQ